MLNQLLISYQNRIKETCKSERKEKHSTCNQRELSENIISESESTTRKANALQYQKYDPYKEMNEHFVTSNNNKQSRNSKLPSSISSQS